MYSIILAIMIIYATVRIFDRSFQSSYVVFSIIFMYLFYFFPLYYINIGNYGVYFNNLYYINKEKYYFLYGSFFIFFIGFLGCDLILKTAFPANFKKTQLLYIRKQTKVAIFLNFIFMIFSISIIYYLFSVKFIENFYKVRAGEIKGSYLLFILISVFQVVAIFWTGYFQYYKKYFFMFIWFFIFVIFSTFIFGRINIAISIFIFLVIIKIPMRLCMIFFALLIPFLLPVIVNGKSIIMNLLTDGILISDLHPVESIDIFSNFGHPLFSLLVADDTINRIGMRYGYDYVHGLIFYLRIFGIDMGDSLIYHNTYSFIRKQISIVPTGYLAFGYIQFGFLGIVISGIFYRLIGFFIGKFINLMIRRSSVIYYYLLIISSYSFYLGEIRVIVMAVFVQVIVLSLLISLTSYGKK